MFVVVMKLSPVLLNGRMENDVEMTFGAGTKRGR